MTLRYGHGKPVHPELEETCKSYHPTYKRWLDNMLSFQADYETILDRGTPEFYSNAILCYDCAAIHTMVSTIRPAKWVEIGSGHSTSFALNAAQMYQTGTHFEIVDPIAGAWLENFPVEVHRCRADEVSTDIFTSLEEDDILFVDGSHIGNAGSDVVIVFLEVLPRLKPGVWVHFHDIFLPSDYRPNWGGREEQYTEQYLLAQLLLLDRGERYRIELPMYYCQRQREFREQLHELDRTWIRRGERVKWLAHREAHPGEQSPWDLSGYSFWMRVR